jgi:phosphoenolpyruvate carboxylase
LIELFTSNIEPFPVKETLISDVRHIQKELLIKDAQLQESQAKAKELENIIGQMRAAQENNQQEMPELIDQLEALNTSEQCKKTHRLTNCVHS